MKTFILSVSKYKKWITLGLSIICFVLFLFPRFAQNFPYFIGLPLFYLDLGNRAGIGSHNIFSWGDTSIRLIFSFYIIYIVLIAASLICATVCTILQFKNKKQFFYCTLIFACLAMFFQAFQFEDMETSGVGFSLCFNFYIFLVLLILDIVYLALEKHYLKPTDSGQ